jgi:hypothetical protein
MATSVCRAATDRARGGPEPRPFTAVAPWRTDNSCGGAVLQDRAVGGAAITGTVRRERRSIRRSDQGAAPLGRGRHCPDRSACGQDAACVRCDVISRRTCLPAIGRPEYLQAGAVDQHVQRAILWMSLPAAPRDRCLRPAAQHRVIGNRQIEQRDHQPFALANTKPEHTTQRQDRLDGKIGITWLGTAGPSPRRLPSSQCVLRHPQRQASSPPQACLVRRPVRHLVFHLRYSVTAGGIVFEGNLAKISSLVISPAYQQALKTIHAPTPPLEVFISTDERIAFSYLSKPIVDQFARAFREQ